MKRVYKYPIEIQDLQTIAMPAGAEPIFVAAQYGLPQLWALVDPTKPETDRHFRLAGTGHVIAEPVHHIGSFLMRNDSLVFHLFEIVGEQAS